MFERLRQGVVESYVGAIALGRQFVHFANTFPASVAGRILQLSCQASRSKLLCTS
jgi:hypothetical protein